MTPPSGLDAVYRGSPDLWDHSEMELPNRQDLESGAKRVYESLSPTPQIAWPLLKKRSGVEVWVKHENHLPTGAFKVRGGIVYLSEHRGGGGVIAATRGNHGQSVGFAAAANGLRATIVVPRGNSRSKNDAMRALGVELIEHGDDFQDALVHAEALARAQGLHMVPSFHPTLLRGVASYALELFRGAPPLDVVYVPIGLGSGICSVIAVREALGLHTTVVGVVAEQAPAYQLSMERGEVVETEPPKTMADGLAVRVPNAEALAVMQRHVERVVAVSEDEIRHAVRVYFEDTKNLAEGAGAAPLAALLKERSSQSGRRAGVILSGGNIDVELYREILADA